MASNCSSQMQAAMGHLPAQKPSASNHQLQKEFHMIEPTPYPPDGTNLIPNQLLGLRLQDSCTQPYNRLATPGSHTQNSVFLKLSPNMHTAKAVTILITPPLHVPWGLLKSHEHLTHTHSHTVMVCMFTCTKTGSYTLPQTRALTHARTLNAVCSYAHRHTHRHADTDTHARTHTPC
jgi:hypothetical protein